MSSKSPIKKSPKKSNAKALAELAGWMARVDEFELETALVGEEEDDADFDMSALRRDSDASNASTVRGDAPSFDVGEDEPAPAPRRATHDGTHGKKTELASPAAAKGSGSRKRAQPTSAPHEPSKKVRFAPGLSPKRTRQMLHRRARELGQAEDAAPSWGALPDGASKRKAAAPKRFAAKA